VIEIGTAIRLPTEYGTVIVRHVQFRRAPSESGPAAAPPEKEGIVVSNDLPTFSTPTLVRLQSSCLFGEALWATDCDCGLQLHLSLGEIIRENGLLLYLYEEGRGAGLRRKIEAIALQQTLGIESDEAFQCLSLDSDLRTYEAASEALVAILGSNPKVVLLTNNPAKARGLTAHGIEVVGTRKLIPEKLTEKVKVYLRKKRERLGHSISEEDLK